MPFKYTEEEKASFKASIIKYMADGIALAETCRELGISREVVYDWKDQDADFNTHFARAREIGYDAIAERLRDTARGRGESSQDVARDKLIIQTDLDLLAKWSKKYGARVVNEMVGKDDGAIQYESKSLTTEQIIELAKERGLPTSIFEK